VINRKLKKIVLLEFKRTSDYGESDFKDMWGVTEKQHTQCSKTYCRSAVG
jgi:hypothetical protein